MLYEYDFGDSWTHRIVLEKILPSSATPKTPKCIAGARACPPEDCGGPYGYAEFLMAIKDPSRPEHEEMLDWIGLEVTMIRGSLTPRTSTNTSPARE
jgi:hypothetical protein